jgi:sulfur-oxidizing protein SoxY
MKRPALLRMAAMLALSAPAQGAAPADPLDSPMWANHAAWLLGQATVRFDPAVIVTMPDVTENQHAFPVTVDARALAGVRRIVVLMDLNPLPVAIDYRPQAALPYVSLRIKLDQRTPVRALVLTADGVWHVAGRWIDAAGGGCSAPPVSRVKGDWAQHLGEMRGGLWREAGDTRLRLAVRHPMDTGYVDNIAAYNIEALTVTGSDGTTLGTMAINGSVAEDPAFTLLLPANLPGPVRVHMADSNGRTFAGTLAP